MVSESAQVLQGGLVKLLLEALFWFPGDLQLLLRIISSGVICLGKALMV